MADLGLEHITGHQACSAAASDMARAVISTLQIPKQLHTRALHGNLGQGCTSQPWQQRQMGQSMVIEQDPEGGAVCVTEAR
jgi:hypothetical protein